MNFFFKRILNPLDSIVGAISFSLLCNGSLGAAVIIFIFGSIASLIGSQMIQEQKEEPAS